MSSNKFPWITATLFTIGIATAVALWLMGSVYAHLPIAFFLGWNVAEMTAGRPR